MKIALNWLKNHIDLKENGEELSRILTSAGLEVEGVETFCSVPGGLKGLVVGEVLTCERHPNADRLSKTTVDVGNGQVLPIVCGAPNVAAGQKVVVAVPGTTIYPTGGEPFTISKSKIRGEVSEGMICAEDEIGLGQSHAGILVLAPEAVPGTPAAEYFKIESDEVLEIGLTANRGDAASHRGVARDLSATLHRELKPFEPVISEVSGSQGWSVELKSPECARYSGILVENITVKESPEWLKTHLRSLGLNPINVVVDITNFVLHDIGQPIHAFDAARISGKKIVVRKSSPEETIVTLDGNERKLDGTELLICDDSRPLALAGVFGGKESGVNENTRAVFIESAWFQPASIRKTAKKHGLNTDASFRYERGADPEITVKALKKVAGLLVELAGGLVASEIIDMYPEPISPFQVRLRRHRIKGLLGQEIPDTETERILKSLEIQIAGRDEAGWDLLVPPFKSDVTREADVIEELLRIYGLHHIELPERSLVSFGQRKKPDVFALKRRASDYLVSRGFVEIASNSMTKAAYFDEAGKESWVYIKNPLSSDMEIMRPGFLPSFLEAVAYNKNRRQQDLRLFEFGKTYRRQEDGVYQESRRLGLIVSGNWNLESWHQKQVEADYYHLRQEVNHLLSRLGLTVRESKQKLGPWNTTEATPDWIQIGPVDPALLRKFDIQGRVYYAELDWDQLLKGIQPKDRLNSEPAPRFPEVRRDLSLVLDKQTSFAEIKKVIRETDKGLIREVNVFDVYEGEKLGEGKKSYSISFLLRDEEKTLSDKEIDALMQRLITNFENKTGAIIRK